MSYCDNRVLLLKTGKVPIYSKRAVGGVELNISAHNFQHRIDITVMPWKKVRLLHHRPL
jgi:hypothetical protein